MMRDKLFLVFLGALLVVAALIFASGGRSSSAEAFFHRQLLAVGQGPCTQSAGHGRRSECASVCCVNGFCEAAESCGPRWPQAARARLASSTGNLPVGAQGCGSGSDCASGCCVSGFCENTNTCEP